MFNTSFEQTLNTTYVRARDKKHEYITVEHLLLCMLDNDEVMVALSTCGANMDRLRAGLGIFVHETTPHVPPHIERDAQPTLGFQRVLQRAIYQAQASHLSEVSAVNALLAIFGERESQAVYFLHQEGVSRLDVFNYIAQKLYKDQQDTSGEVSATPDYNAQESQPKGTDHVDASIQEVSTEENLIDTYATNLNEQALMGRIDPLIGRELEVQRCTQILCRRNKNNPLFVGQAGVGKTAIAEGLAQMIVQGSVPAPLLSSTVYSLDLGVLLAGTKYRGDFEKRFKSVLNALMREPNSIVFIDEIHNLVGAGAAAGGAMDASNLIKPMLTSGELRCIGATTYDEFRNHFAKDSALLRRFQKVDVTEPNAKDSLAILQGLQGYYEAYHSVQYTDDALARAVQLAIRYLPERFMPDKAIDLIDEAGAYHRLQDKKDQKSCIDASDIEYVMARTAQIPIERLTQSDKEKLKTLPRQLQKKVFGQDHAVNTLVEAIRLSRSGLRNPDKPIGSYLLAGPTGVGKTELVKQLALSLGIELIRFDMSEYMERHTISRLIGAPPGYVGFDQGGLLTEAVTKKPHAIVLLDEIEKAHPDLFNLLLQVMDYGQLTDNNGRKADFRHVIIAMTTNMGAKQFEKSDIGFMHQDHDQDAQAEIKQGFSPEFRNRLDAVVQFAHLDTQVITRVAEKCLLELSEQLADKGYDFQITSAAKQWLATHGFDPLMGARPMERLVETAIKQPIANEILFQRSSKKRKTVRVFIDNGGIKIEVKKNPSLV